MKIKDLTPSLMETFPVWKWDSSMEYMMPVEQYVPLPENEHPMFISAELKFGGVDKCVKGYLVGSDHYYAVGVFLGNEEYVINLNLLDQVGPFLDILSHYLKVEVGDLFPIVYSTDVSFEEGNALQGEIVLPTQ